MSLLLNEEQQFLKDTAKEFLQKNAPISHFRNLRDSKDETGYSKEVWKQMAELGWAGILISEDSVSYTHLRANETVLDIV